MGVVKKEGNAVFVQEGDRWRKVGDIEVNEDFTLLKTHRNKSQHLMKVWNAYGFATDVMDHDDWFDYVLLEEEDGKTTNRYFIPRADIILEGRRYQTEGFERQYFLTLELLQQYKQ